MTKVLTHMCMSLDGFVAQLDNNPAELFDWYWIGDVVVPSAQETTSFSVDAASAAMLQDLTSGCGALVAGRRLFDQTDGWGDNHPVGAPVVVVTSACRSSPERLTGTALSFSWLHSTKTGLQSPTNPYRRCRRDLGELPQTDNFDGART